MLWAVLRGKTGVCRLAAKSGLFEMIVERPEESVTRIIGFYDLNRDL